MRSYEERAKDFIKEIFPYIENCNNPRIIRRIIDVYNTQHNRKILVRNGLSRIALITSDYVIKFNYDEEEISRIGGCAEEIEMYSNAEQEGFAYMFAKITQYTYNECDFYIMPRINNVGKYPFHEADEFMTRVEIEFCKRYGLTDLHSKNYGFRNGKVCLVDYACNGFYS